jgi:tetratricopeptide (TPR) repeat protein
MMLTDPMFRRFGPLFILCLLLIAAPACGWRSESAKRRYMEQGDALFKAGKFREAEITFRKAIQADRQFGEAYQKVGLANIRLDRLSRGISFLQRAATLMPDNMEVRVILADIYLTGYFSDDSRPEALLDLVKGILKHLEAKTPGSYDAFRISGFVAAAEKRNQEAIDHFLRAESLKPLQAGVVDSLLRLYLIEKQPAKGEELALAFLDKNKNHGPVYDLLYTHYLSEKRLQDADRILNSKVAHNPKVGPYRIQLATHLLFQGKPREAAQEIQYLVGNPKDFPTAFLDAGGFYFRAQNWAEAARYFEEGAKANPSAKIEYQKKLADVHLAKGDIPGAIAILDTALAENPKDAGARASRALLRLNSIEQAEIASAAETFASLVKEDPSNGTFHFYMGRANIARGQLADAEKNFRDTLRHLPNFAAAQLALIETQLDLRQYSVALGQVQEFLAKYPQHPRGRLLSAATQVGLGNFKIARAELASLISQFPQFGEARLQAALLDIAEKKYPEAEKSLLGFYRPKQNDPRVLRAFTELYFAQQQTDKALALLQRDLNDGSLQPMRTRQILAEAAVRAGRLDLAIDSYKQMFQDPMTKSSDLHYHIGSIYFSKGDVKNAMTHLEQAREAAPKDPVVLTTLGSVLEGVGQASRAQQLYRDSLLVDPENPVALNNLAFNIAQNGGNLDDALKYAERALQKLPDHPMVSDTIGYIYVKKNMPDAAIQVFQNLVRKDPSSPVLRYHFAEALLQKGEREKAKAELQAALSQGPTPSQEAKIKELLKRLA